MKTQTIMTQKKKRNSKNEYVSPEIQVELIEMEQGIAAGSAQVKPNSPNEEWETEEQNGNLDW